MTSPANETDLLIDRLGKRHGKLFSEKLGIELTRNTPSALFRWICAALLTSARISRDTALEAAGALSEAGRTSAEGRADGTCQDRVETLNGAGCARYDESTARMPGDAARLLCEKGDGDLRSLRAASDRDPQGQRTALQAFRGIGEVGADIFLRGNRSVRTGHFPFMDEPARTAAHRPGRPDTAEALAQNVAPEPLLRMVTARARAELEAIERADLREDAERTSP